MEETRTKRKLNRRSVDERVAEIDKKIDGHKDAIAKLEERKYAILNPKPRPSKAAKAKQIIAKAREGGLTDEELDALVEEGIIKKNTRAEE